MPIVNSSAKNTYFTNAGVATSATTQPNIDDTVMAGVRDASLGADMYGFVSSTVFSAYTGYDNTQIIMGTANTLRGAVNNTLRSQGSEAGRESVHQMDALRVHLVSSGIRAGLWNEYSGRFTPALPAAINMFSNVGNDVSADANRDAPGNFTYAYAGSGIVDNYDKKTN